MYSTAERAFGPEWVTLMKAFAGYAGIAVANTALYQSAVEEARHMHEALKTRAVIEQAKGIVMGSRRCSADDAFLCSPGGRSTRTESSATSPSSLSTAPSGGQNVMASR